MKKKTTELPNYNTKTSTGRIKSKKSRRFANDDLHVAESYKENLKFGINSLVENALEADDNEQEDLTHGEFCEEHDIFDEELDNFVEYYQPNLDDEHDYTYGYN
jgi:hypothetical protein